MIDLEGLLDYQPERTDRIATGRNTYMDFIRGSESPATTTWSCSTSTR